MASEYDSTTNQLLAQSTTALSYASMSAGRINLSVKPSLKETGFKYTVPDLALDAPPKFSDLFDGADNANGNYNILDDQVDAWLAKYFPAINGSFKSVPEDYLVNIISGVKPFGIDSTIFDLVWQRARDRAYRTTLSEQRTLEANMSSRGFSLPNGVLVDLSAQSERRATDSILDVNREQAVKDADIKNQLLQQAVQVASQLKMGILNTSAEFFKAYYGLLELDQEAARIRAQAYQAYYNALASYYGVETTIEQLKLQAAQGTSQVDNLIDRNRISVFASDGTASAHANAARGFADVAAQSAGAAGTLVAQIEAIPPS